MINTMAEPEPEPEPKPEDLSTTYDDSIENIDSNVELPVDGNLADLIFNAEITDKPEGETEEDGEQHATIDELASVLLQPEEIQPNSKREFAKNLLNSFRTCQTFMSILGRFPVVSTENEDHSILFEAALSSSFRGALFVVTFFILFVLTFLSSFNVISTMLNFPPQPADGKTVTWSLKADPTNKSGAMTWKPIFEVWKDNKNLPKWAVLHNISNPTRTVYKSQKVLRAEEMFIFRRNMAALLILLFLMYHLVLSDLKLYRKRKFVVEYLTCWTESVEIMKIDAANDAKKYVKRFLIYYILWFLVFVATIVANIAPVASGAPVSFTFIWIRCFYSTIHAVDDYWITVLRGIGGVMYLYIVICSKVYILFFLYVCKILKTACTVWNERLERVFTKEERQKSRKEKCASRTGYDHLFKDYVNLLDLLSGADALFANIIESYFSMTLMSIVFEVYYLVRPLSNTQTEFSGARTFDMCIVGIYLANSLLLLYLVSTGAAAVGEASADGLEIIRRQGIMGHRSDSEMHFMISLYMSFTGHFDTALTGGGYFILDKAFFVAIAGTLISYIIIIFQFQPTLAMSNPEQHKLLGLDNTFNLHNLVFHVENTFYYQENREPGS